jgi:hypothetical protein
VAECVTCGGRHTLSLQTAIVRMWVLASVHIRRRMQRERKVQSS